MSLDNAFMTDQVHVVGLHAGVADDTVGVAGFDIVR